MVALVRKHSGGARQQVVETLVVRSHEFERSFEFRSYLRRLTVARAYFSDSLRVHRETEHMAQPLARTDAAPLPDSALITAWQAGDEQAATELVGRHAQPLARFLAGAGAPEADVDDLVQETFIRAFRSVDRFRGQCQFRTWLLTIGGNVLKDFGRRAARSDAVG